MENLNYYEGTVTGSNIGINPSYPQYPKHACPNCGYCPHCGRGINAQPAPIPWLGYPQPFIGDWPYNNTSIVSNFQSWN